MSLSGDTTPGQHRPGSSDNEQLLHIAQIFKAKASSSDCLLLYSLKIQHDWSLTVGLFDAISRTLPGSVLPLYRDTVGVLYSLSRLD